jgi:hypothetical protein
MILINEKDLLRVFCKIEDFCSKHVPKKNKISQRGRKEEYPDALILFIWIYKKLKGIRRDTDLFDRINDSVFFNNNFNKTPHRTSYVKRKPKLEFVMKKIETILLSEFEISDERIVDSTYQVVMEKPRVNIRTYSRFNDGRFGHCARLKSFFGYKFHGALDPLTKIFPEWSFVSGNHHDVVMLPNLNRGSPELRYIGDLGYRGAKGYISQGVKIVGGGERLLIESEFNVIQEHMANRYVRCYKSIYTKLEMRVAHLAHTFSKWIKLLLNLIFHKSFDKISSSTSKSCSYEM